MNLEGKGSRRSTMVEQMLTSWIGLPFFDGDADAAS